MAANNIVKKFKCIISCVPTSITMKHQLELIVDQYNDDDNPETLSKLVNQIYDLLTQNQGRISNTGTQIEAADLVQSGPRITTKATNQKLLNEIFEEFDVLLADALPAGDDLCQFNIVKEKIREIFINLIKQNHLLQNEIIGLEARLTSLERLDSDSNIIRMRNIGLQLRNKLVRFVKPNLSCRAARDEQLSMLQTEERYQELANFIKSHDCNVKISDLARSIRTVQRARVSKAHDETPLSNSDIDSILQEYVSIADLESKQAATVVVHFLKIMSNHLNEPLIVDLS